MSHLKLQRPAVAQEADEYADILESARNPREVEEQPPLMSEWAAHVTWNCVTVDGAIERTNATLDAIEQRRAKHG